MRSSIVSDAKKILIFSDTHLTHVFEKKKFEVLKKLISQVDLVVINGDFWDYYLTEWEDFIQSDWKHLFPLLKSKNAIYVYGNHDQKKHSDERVALFSVEQAEKYKLPLKGKTLHIEHGHFITPTIDIQFPILGKKSLVSFAEIFERRNMFFLSKVILDRFEWRSNRRMKAFAKKHLLENEILICGHSHKIDFSEPDKFINTGWLRYGTVQCLLIQDGKFIAIDETY